MNTVLGYNVLFKVNGKAFAGVTTDSLNISAIIKESLMKSRKGNKTYTVTGHEVSVDCSGVVMVSEVGDTTATEEVNIMDLALLKGSEAEMEFLYLAGNGESYDGTCIIASYKEDSGSEDEATYSVSLRVMNFAKLA